VSAGPSHAVAVGPVAPRSIRHWVAAPRVCPLTSLILNILPRFQPLVSFNNSTPSKRQSLWSSGQTSWLLAQRSRVGFPALPD
jgi:hypothetical protein